ncbi:MAG: type IV pilus assembly protein PilE [Alphaproteobacteria bacterium]|jgi:type IV pilus assembly protein PilE
MLVEQSKGFTLIELMIVVAIISIISAVAYPSYHGMVASSARGAAQADLMAFASAMERHSASNFTYGGAAVANADIGAPAIFAAYSPASELSGNQKYTLSIDSVSTNGQAYLLKAVPVVGSSVAGTGDLYLYSDGRKGWDVDADGTLESGEFCWNC